YVRLRSHRCGHRSLATNLDGLDKKRFLGTAGPRAAAGVLPRLHVGRELGNLVERVAAQRIVHPAALSPIGYESRVLERLQMEGQPRLRRIEHVLQLA